MVNSPSISENIPTMPNSKYFIAGDGIQTVSLAMQREEPPSDVVQ